MVDIFIVDGMERDEVYKQLSTFRESIAGIVAHGRGAGDCSVVRFSDNDDGQAWELSGGESLGGFALIVNGHSLVRCFSSFAFPCLQSKQNRTDYHIAIHHQLCNKRSKYLTSKFWSPLPKVCSGVDNDSAVYPFILLSFVSQEMAVGKKANSLQTARMMWELKSENLIVLLKILIEFPSLLQVYG